MGQNGATDRERLYGIAGRAAAEAALAHGLDGGRVRRVTDAFVLSRIARAVVDALCDEAGTEPDRYLTRDGEVQYAWLIWGRQPGTNSKPLGCYASREVALAAEEMMRALPEAAEWEDIWTTPWPLATVPRVNFRMLRPTSRAQGE